ncbi:acyltransferase family protein [Herbaspirillum robiniae]|uniref:Acyltransferase n=1 Tax=Herbaspirillum robiniae TaxID=2014887 RepID=A0ABX2MA63_9BURK|nr:acyltransferase family protein [Herbaspirillum robiniae]NUU04719.1 acyltransferase [Herbaspirillum robiniae]
MTISSGPMAADGVAIASAAPASRIAAHIGEIDGLRAVAVLAVILYHFGITQAAGGFVGVDVFFVISGFLITGILLKPGGDSDTRARLAQFWSRRILRITPALFVMLLLSATVFLVVLPPRMSSTLVPAFTSATFSYSNFWLRLTVDYFNAGVTNPILHTWSLAVEEQFYLLFPLLIATIGARRRVLLKWLVIALLAISLIAACIVAPVGQADAFYLPWLRAWELFAGALVCFAPVAQLPDAARRLLSNAGLLAVAASCALYHEQMVFPGLLALPPVLGAVGIVAGAGSDSIANRLLRLKPMQWVGKISYSLYLVHWPLACLASLTVTLYPRPVKAALLMVSVLLAWLSWRLVEQPMRALASRVAPRKVIAGFAVSACAMLALFSGLQSAGRFAWSQFPEALGYTAALDPDITLFKTGSCLLTPKFPDLKYFDAAKCLAVTDKQPTVLVMGDSHAANIVDALAAQHPSLHFVQATSVGCKPTFHTAGPAYCRELMEHTLRQWLQEEGRNVDTVVLGARWEAPDLENLKETLRFLAQKGKKAIVYGPSPEYFIAVPLLLSYQNIFHLDLDSIFYRAELFRLHLAFRAALAGQATYFSAFDSMCQGRQCTVLSPGGPNFSDRDHFTRSGAQLAVKGFPLP